MCSADAKRPLERPMLRCLGVKACSCIIPDKNQKDKILSFPTREVQSSHRLLPLTKTEETPQKQEQRNNRRPKSSSPLQKLMLHGSQSCLPARCAVNSNHTHMNTPTFTDTNRISFHSYASTHTRTNTHFCCSRTLPGSNFCLDDQLKHPCGERGREARFLFLS